MKTISPSILLLAWLTLSMVCVPIATTIAHAERSIAPGVRIRVELRDQERVTGTIVRADGEGLQVSRAGRRKPDFCLDFDEILQIEVRRARSTDARTGIFLLGGATALGAWFLAAPPNTTAPDFRRGRVIVAKDEPWYWVISSLAFVAGGATSLQLFGATWERVDLTPWSADPRHGAPTGAALTVRF